MVPVDPANKRPAATPAGLNADTSRTAVLAVDDTPANLVAYGALLKSLDVDVVGADSGPMALTLAGEREFAAILLDVMMPGMDGFETLVRLRANPATRTTPVLFITAHDLDRSAIRKAYALGAVDYITKPIEPEIFDAKVRAFVALHEQARALARQADALRTKDRYIGVLAHDLRNPLSVVGITASRLAKHADPAVVASAARVHRAVLRMEKLTEDVLTFARAAAGRLPVERSRTELCELCREMLDDFEATHPDTKFSLEHPPCAWGLWDRARLQQALSNLVGNAIAYGSGWVRLRVEQAPNEVVISVENGGEPINPERLPRLFQPFERGSGSGRGTGLGLYIVREIVRAHAGEVEVTSDHERTIFRLRLPMGAASAVANGRA